MKTLITGIGIAQAIKKQCSMNKTATKLRYQYSDEPHGYVGHDGWGQNMTFEIELHTKTKKELLKNRAALVRDVAKVFKKYGMSTDEFSCVNDWI